MYSFTDDPVLDASNFAYEMEQINKENEIRCDCCNEPIDLEYYDFDGTIICSNCLIEKFYRHI